MSDPAIVGKRISRRTTRRDLKIDTRRCLKGIMKETGRSLRATSRMLGASHSAMCRCMKKRGVTLDTLADYAHIVYMKTGIKLIFTVTPDLRLAFTIDDGDPQVINAINLD